MKRMLRVAVLGIPLVGRAMDLPQFAPGSTDLIRREVSNHLSERTRDFGMRVEVRDLGEMTPNERRLTELRRTMAEDLLYRMPRGLDREQLSRMQYSRRLRELLAAYGRRLAKLSRTYDLLLVVGGNHAAALPLYAVPGRVARFDAHTDADENPLLRNTSYVYHAVKEGGLKKPGLVTHYSAEHYSVKRPQEPRINLGSPEQALSAEAHVVDIDVDALHRKYETATYETDAMLVSQFGPVVMRSAPKIVGVFEYYPHADKHGVGMRFIKAIALQALKVRARKLAGK